MQIFLINCVATLPLGDISPRVGESIIRVFPCQRGASFKAFTRFSPQRNCCTYLPKEKMGSPRHAAAREFLQSGLFSKLTTFGELENRLAAFTEDWKRG